MVGRNPEVGRAVLEHREHRRNHRPRRAEPFLQTGFHGGLATLRPKGQVSAFVGQLRLSVHGTAPVPMRAMGSFDDCQEHVFKRSISPRKRCIFLACVILLAKHSCRPKNAETWSR